MSIIPIPTYNNPYPDEMPMGDMNQYLSSIGMGGLVDQILLMCVGIIILMIIITVAPLLIRWYIKKKNQGSPREDKEHMNEHTRVGNMGMFDSITIEGLKCPICGKDLKDFQTKDGPKRLAEYVAGKQYDELKRFRYLIAYDFCTHNDVTSMIYIKIPISEDGTILTDGIKMWVDQL